MQSSFYDAMRKVEELQGQLIDAAQGLDIIFSAPTKIKTAEGYKIEVEYGWLEKIVSIAPVGEPDLIVRVGDLVKLGQDLTWIRADRTRPVSARAGELVRVRNIYFPSSGLALGVRIRVTDQGLPHRLPIDFFDQEFTRHINQLARV